jgi:hypothetical protein
VPLGGSTGLRREPRTRILCSKSGYPMSPTSTWGATEGSKSNIPCCALLARSCAQHLRRIHGCDAHPASIWRTFGHANAICAKFAYDVRHVTRVSCKCCVHLPWEERATRDVTFGPLCSFLGQQSIWTQIRLYVTIRIFLSKFLHANLARS